VGGEAVGRQQDPGLVPGATPPDHSPRPVEGGAGIWDVVVQCSEDEGAEGGGRCSEADGGERPLSRFSRRYPVSGRYRDVGPARSSPSDPCPARRLIAVICNTVHKQACDMQRRESGAGRGGGYGLTRPSCDATRALVSIVIPVAEPVSIPVRVRIRRSR